MLGTVLLCSSILFFLFRRLLRIDAFSVFVLLLSWWTHINSGYGQWSRSCSTLFFYRLSESSLGLFMFFLYLTDDQFFFNTSSCGLRTRKTRIVIALLDHLDTILEDTWLRLRLSRSNSMFSKSETSGFLAVSYYRLKLTLNYQIIDLQRLTIDEQWTRGNTARTGPQSGVHDLCLFRLVPVVRCPINFDCFSSIARRE